MISSKSKPKIVFHLVTIFPKLIDSYWRESIIGRAIKQGLIRVVTHNLRDFSADQKHRRIDGRPYGGGPGMVFEAEPIVRAVTKIRGRRRSKKVKVLIMAAGGRPFTNRLAERWAKQYEQIILIAGRYEGIDARVRRLISGAEEISVGPYVLTGGELPAAVIVDAMSRQIPGVLHAEQSLEEKRISSRAVYTRPEVITFRGRRFRVPKILLSGDHAKIDEWKAKPNRQFDLSPPIPET
ncbi:MAG: tRNA (guanosine(37)-N1)-methyltransferase TrmD [Patescibacteria group bacterium]